MLVGHSYQHWLDIEKISRKKSQAIREAVSCLQLHDREGAARAYATAKQLQAQIVAKHEVCHG
jgi:hypothetical protein